MKTYRAIGLMSGSSLDGLDVAFCTFSRYNNKWIYKIVSAETYRYGGQLYTQLKSASTLSGFELQKLNRDFGKFSADCVNTFIKRHGIHKKSVDVISSHGHTVFHQPHLGFSTQIGCGATINGITGITTVCDFRSTDIALGGQGAPLVPVGDELLFSEYSACLNLGGIANISYAKEDKRLAYDICFCNIPINYLTNRYFNCEFDRNGALGKKGNLIGAMLNNLSSLSYYKKTPPKSLGREDFEKDILPFLTYLPVDSLRTLYEHFADVIAQELNQHETTLVTGGGTYNTFFIELLKEKTSSQIIVPDDYTIQFKEALIFAFLGVLRTIDTTNTLQSVTGAKRNSVGGAVYKSL